MILKEKRRSLIRPGFGVLFARNIGKKIAWKFDSFRVTHNISYSITYSYSVPPNPHFLQTYPRYQPYKFDQIWRVWRHRVRSQHVIRSELRFWGIFHICFILNMKHQKNVGLPNPWSRSVKPNEGSEITRRG